MADESKTFCDIYENRPEVCRLYHCLKCDDDKPAPLTATFIIDPERVGRALILERIRRAFDREISRMIDDHEPSTRIEWLQALRDEVLGLIK
jgi:Fe-S-cluster containining protein